MQFLSVAARELRVAARKRSSFRVRMYTSAFALLIPAFNLWLVTFFGGRPVSGEQLFFNLSWVSFACACLIGPALTADSVNEERNNGTLGLLFLTNLNGISIALGKLLGHGMLALFSIVSIVPVMALPALLGGADAQSMVKTALVLLTTLLLSLIIGMFASTLCRKPWMAAALALSLIAFLVLGIPLVGLALRVDQQLDLALTLELLSPSYALSMAGLTGAMTPVNRLWRALSTQLFLACAFFGLITFLLPRIWIEGKSGRTLRSLFSAWNSLKYGSTHARRKLRTHLLQFNPILWLSCRDRFGGASFAAVLLLASFAIFWIGQGSRVGPSPNDDFLSRMIVWIIGIPLLYLCFCFRLAVAASERFALDRKTGALELILCTPLKTREIIRGHWLGLFRRFWAAAILLLALHAFVLHYIIEATRIQTPIPDFSFLRVIVRTFEHLFGVAPIPNLVAPFYIACLAVFTAAILIVVLWIALAWIAMALSLKLKREIFAPWISLFVLAVPPIPIFLGLLPITADQQLFNANLFLGMFRVGATGFFIVLINALIWMFFARRWTYNKIRPNQLLSR